MLGDLHSHKFSSVFPVKCNVSHYTLPLYLLCFFFGFKGLVVSLHLRLIFHIVSYLHSFELKCINFFPLSRLRRILHLITIFDEDCKSQNLAFLAQWGTLNNKKSLIMDNSQHLWELCRQWARKSLRVCNKHLRVWILLEVTSLL
jgi:hypothetical protein